MQELFNLFEKIGLPYFRQGSLSDEDYKDSFFTYWNINTPNTSYYDNNETRYIEDVMIYFYTNDAKLIYSKMDEFIEEAKKAGFVVTSRAYDTPADKDNYYGRLVRINIIHKED